MAYGVLYEFRRTSTNGADILITISQRDYEGEVKKRSLGRAPVIKRENNGHIYGTSCELYAECLIDGEFSQLYTSDAYEFRVEVYRNDSLLWMGFVSPELYSEPDVAPPYDAHIIATDGLGELKNFKFEKRGVASMLSHINYLMGKTGIGMALNIVSELRYVDDTGVASADKGVLDFKINLDHEEGSTCYDVLQNLLSSINANITQYNGRYLIFREPDFINKTTEEGVEGFDINGSAVSLPVASFGSMNQHKWWPVGQLSTVIEPAKNEVVLRAPDHYKDNVLDFDDWALANAASFNEEEGAYILPDEGSNISQYVDFDGVEVGYRLGLRVRARNVGSSEDEQNIGIKVEIEGRSYSAGDRYWLVKSSGTSSGRQLTDYMWRNVDGYIEEELPLPSDADTDSDAQDIDIVLPLYRNGSRSYVYAKNVKLTIFNPAGIHDIYVYDVSLVKYEQIEGYEADVVINNAAREEEGEVELTMSAGDLAPAAGKVFMTGIPLLPSGSDPIKQWQVGDGNHQDYLSVMAYDYSRAIALPKMKYAGVLNVPGETVSVPLLFLRDGTYYFPKTYTYDIYNDELEIELISISAADVSLSSVIISQMAQSSGNMGGLTTSGFGGGGVVSLPRDKEMSDTSDNAVENRVIKAYVDGEVKSVVDLLASMWYLDDDGNVRTKHNVVIEGDTSSGGEGEDTPSAGLDEEQLQAYLDEHKYVTEDDIAGLIPDVDLSGYYTSEQTDSAISTAIANLINGAPTTLDTLKEIADALEENEDVVDALEEAIGKKADASALTTLASRVSTAETNITNLTNNKANKATTLAGYGITNAYTKTEIDTKVTTINNSISGVSGRVTTLETWKSDISKYITIVDGNVKIGTNLIVTGDTSNGGESGETGTAIGSMLTKWTDYNASTMSGYVLAASLGYDLHTRVNSLEANGALSFTTTGSGNAVTSISKSGTTVTVTKGTSFLPLAGGVISGSNFSPLHIKSSTASYAGLGLRLSGSTYSAYLLYKGDTTWAVTGENWTGEKTLIHTGNIGNQKVAGLVTPRTIWGQSFDGTENVSGGLYLDTSSIFMSYNGNDMTIVTPSAGKPIFGYGTSAKGYDTYIDGYKILFRYGTSHTEGLILNSSGNVGIGTSSPAYNLDVTGTGRFTGSVTMSSTLSVNGQLTIAGKEAATAIMSFSRTNANYIIAPTGGTINFGVTGVTGIAVSRLRIESTHVSKGTGVDVNLGQEDNPWSTIYGVNGNFTSVTIAELTLAQQAKVLKVTNEYGYAQIGPQNTSHCHIYTDLPTFYLNKGMVVVGQVRPSADATYTLGASTHRWNEIHAKTGCIAELYGGTTSTFAWRLIKDTDSNGIWLQSKLVDNTSNSGKFYISGVSAANLESFTVYATTSYFKGNVLPQTSLGYNLGSSTVSWNKTYTRYIDTLSGYYLRFCVGGTEYMQLTDTAQLKTSTDIIPTADAIYTLGSSSFRWSTIYGGAGNYGVATNHVLLKPTNVCINTTTTGEWARRFSITQNEVQMISFGAFGAGATISYGYIGTDYEAPWVKLTSANTTFYGNVIVTGDTSNGSDIRFKDIIKDKTLKIEDIAKAPLFTFRWNDRDDNTIHLGSSAQYWESVAPWLVTGEDFKSLNYATLGVAMGISLAKKAVNHEERIKELEKEIKRLKEEMRYA